MHWLRSFRGRVALFSALLILLIIVGLGAILRYFMQGLLIDSLDQRLEAQAEYYMPIRHYLSDDPFQISELPLPHLPRGDGPIAFIAFDPKGLLLLNRRVPPQLDIQQIWTLASQHIDNADGEFRFDNYPTEKEMWRLASTRHDGVTFVWAKHTRFLPIAMAKLDRAFLTMLPIALLLAGIGGWEIGRRTIKPVKKLAQRMRKIDAAGLDKRLEEDGSTSEIRELIQNHNKMLDRLERQFHQASRFSADAAHELNTPLTIIQSTVENRLRDENASDEDLRFCESMLEEIMRLKAMAQKLLMLAHSDAGKMRLSRETIDLSQLAEDLWEDIPLINPELAYESCITRGLIVEADNDLLRLAIQNLLTNAIRYNKHHGWVRLTVSYSNGMAEITVANAADPIPAEQAERLFDRFYRADAARAETSGSGLGLSLAKEIADAHHAELALCRNEGGVVAFRLSLACQSSLSVATRGFPRSLADTM